ncbi:MAG TPA: rRNA maturation RNase YbeY [Candidatus Saccharimonadia bacterium]|nr:rRNA maturation RNase YbeY [Candidatus Saccharimonadia bacterium]
MPNLELDILGEVPAELDVAPTRRVFLALVAELPALAPAMVAVGGVINLALVDDERVRQLNRDQAGHDYATDVLSFSYVEDGGEPIDGVVGEMVISLETAARQAAQAGTSLAEEVALLALHGVLHILGYDHQGEAGQIAMQEVQRRLMSQVGYSYREFVWQD